MTSQITITHADASTLSIDTISMSGTYMFPGRGVTPRTKASGTAAAMNDGETTDPNQGFRVITCTTHLNGADVNTLNGKLLPATVPTYDATDPKIVVRLNGTVSHTILIVITAFKYTMIGDDKFSCSFTFTERVT